MQRGHALERSPTTMLLYNAGQISNLNTPTSKPSFSQVQVTVSLRSCLVGKPRFELVGQGFEFGPTGVG
jgi:hypothetical protein